MHQPILAGNGKAALAAALVARLFYDHGIDQLVLALAHVDDDGAAQNAHLRRGDTHAPVLHRLIHIIQQRPEALVKIGDRPAFFAQALVALLENIA